MKKIIDQEFKDLKLEEFRQYLIRNNVAFARSAFMNAELDEAFMMTLEPTDSIQKLSPKVLGYLTWVARGTFAEFEQGDGVEPGYKPIYCVMGAHGEISEPWAYMVESVEEYVAVALSRFLETDEATADQSHPEFSRNYRDYVVALERVGIPSSSYKRALPRILFL